MLRSMRLFRGPRSVNIALARAVSGRNATGSSFFFVSAVGIRRFASVISGADDMCSHRQTPVCTKCLWFSRSEWWAVEYAALLDGVSMELGRSLQSQSSGSRCISTDINDHPHDPPRVRYSVSSHFLSYDTKIHASVRHEVDLVVAGSTT